jgi:hypothetical protein
MITLPTQQLPEVIPQSEIEAFKHEVRKPLEVMVAAAPAEVQGFIAALADKLGNTAQVGQYDVMMTGDDLLLCGNSFEGKRIDRHSIYPVKVPKLQVVDHYSTMHRLYHRKGKQGLIDYCKVHAKGTELEKLLSILTVHVFHQESIRITNLLNEWKSQENTK